MHEPAFRSAIARRIDRFFTPLQKPLCIRERAFFFGVTGSRKKKYFGLDFFRLQFAALDLGRIVPKIRGLNFDHIAHDQPFQFRERLPLEPRIRRPDSGVLTHQKHAIHFFVEHGVEKFEEGMVASEFRKPTVAEPVFRGRALSVICLQGANEIFRVIRPEARLFRVFVEILLERLVALVRHRQVTW